MGIIRAFVRRPVLTSVTVLMAVFIGFYAYFELGVELLPRVDIPVVVVQTVYRGAGPEEIENLISKPIEDALAQVEGVDKIESYSLEGVSFVVAEFEYDINLSEATLDVSNRVKTIVGQLPDEAEDPIVEKFDINAQPFMTLAILSSDPEEEAYTIVEDRIQRQITQIKGLAKADLLGGIKREIHIYVDPADMEQFGIDMQTITRIVAANNLNDPSGHIARGDRELSIRVIGEVDDPKQLEEIRIPLRNGSSVRIGDFARVVDTTEEKRGFARYMGENAIFVDCIASPNANIVEISREIRAELERIRQYMPSGYQIIVTNDEADFIAESVRNVFRDMGYGILLTALILYLFLRRFSVTLVVALSMPTAVIATFMLLFTTNTTLNIMSTLGLAISIGVLVNNAILVIENIFRYRDMGVEPLEAAEKGTGEIALSVLSTTVTNLAVFVPVAFMGGIVGQFFSDFAITVVFATLFSLWVAMTFTPMIAARIRYDEPSRLSRFITGWFHWIYSCFDRAHHKLVMKTLDHPWLTLVLFLVLFTGSIILTRQIGVEFLPRADQGVVTMEIELPPAVSLGYTERITRQIEAFAEDLPDVKAVEVLAGGTGAEQGVNQARIRLFMNDLKDRASTFEIAAQLRPFIASIPDVTPIISAFTSGGPPGRALQIGVIGNDISELDTISQQILRIMRETPGIVEADVNWELGRPEIELAANRWRMAQLELDVSSLADTSRAYITGKEAGVFRSEGKEYDILVKLEPQKVRNVFELPGLPIPTKSGFVPLAIVADVNYGIGPTTILRKDRNRYMAVEADVSGITVGEAFNQILPKIRAIELPPGYRLDFAGEVESIQENFRFMILAFGMAVVLTFMVIAAILESYLFAFIIMLTIPLSAIGVVPLLFLTDVAISVYGLLGVIMLVGLVVNNAIVILDYAEMKRKEGYRPYDAIMEACQIRLRPIVMADITSVIAMVPLGLGLGAGGPFRQPMAIVVIGGLLAGGTLALFAIPPVYERVWAFREWRRKRKEY
ncbi:MAG: efflux RND transporter permease subunit [Synergistales bacterium]|nr:efflux RND transporter permease subunit [Synergistales bacterium]